MKILFYAAFVSIIACAVAGTHAAGKKWLEENKSKEGVIVLSSGLQYKVLRKGDGAFHPTVDSSCECHYEGTLIDGTEFDSSYRRGSPTSFAPNQVIKGWTEAMQLMVEGDKWEMYIPSELAYGDSGSPPKIKGGDPLIFRMEIIKIKGGKKPAVTCDPQTLTNCNEKEQTFITKYKAEGLSAISTELKRLQNIKAKDQKADVQLWLEQRKNILQQLSQKTEL